MNRVINKEKNKLKENNKNTEINFFEIIPLTAKPKTFNTIIKNIEEKRQDDKIESLEVKPLDIISLKDNSMDKFYVFKKDKFSKKYENIANKKILIEYENKLKDIKNDLRKITYEFSLLTLPKIEDENKEDVEELFSKINLVIRKISNLEDKITFNNSYLEDNYLDYVVEKYLDEFKIGKQVTEIKDSSLYILISEKINQLEMAKETLKDRVNIEKLKLLPEEIINMKSEYYNFNNINNELLKIQYEQDSLLRKLMGNTNNITIADRTKEEIKYLSIESSIILKKLKKINLVPGVRSGKAIAFLSATMLLSIKKVKYQRHKNINYKVITIKDYDKNLETDIDKIYSTRKLLTKTSTRLKMFITYLNNNFSQYIKYSDDAKGLLDNLYAIKDIVDEKEYEIGKLEEEKRNTRNIVKEK